MSSPLPMPTTAGRLV